MTRKRCIKILMEAIGSSKYRQTEKAFLVCQKIAREDVPNASNENVLIAMLFKGADMAGDMAGDMEDLEIELRCIARETWLQMRQSMKHRRLFQGGAA